METGNPSSQKQNQYTIVNLARIILIVIISIAAYLFSDLNLGLVSFAFLIFAIFWFILYEFEILNLESYPKVEYIPPAMDICIISYMIYLTGTVNSFLVAGYFYTITICSLNTNIKQGQFAFLFSNFLYIVITLAVYFNYLPAENILSSYSHFSFAHMLLAFILIIVSNYATYRTVNDLASKNENLFSSLVFEKNKAEAANKHKNEILANMSHEIRTPMNAIIGITNHLIEENKNPGNLENLKILKFSADQLLALINDILDISKIEEGKIDFENIDFEIRFLIANIIHSHSLKAKEKGVAVLFELDEKIPTTLIGDPTRIGQIFTNLINNAIKFTDKGSVKITGKIYDLNNQFAYIDFYIRDTGIGIPENKLESIFDKFTQANSETTRKYGGTGLGLTIVSRLLKLMDSKIEVKSKIQEGSEFYFRLKLAIPEFKEREREIKLKQINSTEKNLKGLKLLIVEDNAINIKVLEKFLSKWNLQIHTAMNGKIAVDKVIVEDFDVILMDLQMPEMDGYEAAKAIRSLPDIFKRSIPIIALTADVMLDVREKIISAGMDKFLTKPFQPDELYSVLSTYNKK